MYVVPNYGPANGALIVRQLLQGGFFNFDYQGMPFRNSYGAGSSDSNQNVDLLWNPDAYVGRNLDYIISSTISSEMSAAFRLAFELWDELVTLDITEVFSGTSQITVNTADIAAIGQAVTSSDRLIHLLLSCTTAFFLELKSLSTRAQAI